MMKMKPLLAATALVAAFSTAAIAQDIKRPGTDPNAPATMNRESSTGTVNAGDTQYGVTVFSQDRPTTPMTTQDGYVTGSQGQVLASNLIGESVYNGNGETAEKVGDVRDVLMSSDGKAQAVVIGVGGFLGVGEKDVAVEFGRLSWGVDKGNDKRLMIRASKDDLKTAPTFTR